MPYGHRDGNNFTDPKQGQQSNTSYNIKTCKLASQKEVAGVNSLNCYLGVEQGRPEDYICYK